MKVDTKEQSSTRVLIEVSYEADEVNKKRQALIKDFVKHAKIPGFRPGKVPVQMIQSRYASQLDDELKRTIISDAYKQGVEKADLEIYSVVDIDEGEIAEKAPANLAFTVDIYPNFELDQYKDLPVQSEKAIITDEDVEKAIETLLNQHAEFKKAEKTAEVGDYVKCSYEGKVGRKLIADIAPDKSILGTQKNTWEEAGNADAPGVASIIEALVGMGEGDSKKVEHTFPADYEIKELQKKKATYQIEVHEVREKILPELNEEFLKKINIESVDKLREQYRESLENQKKQQIFSEQRRSVADQLRASVNFDLPESAVKRESDAIMQDFAQQYTSQGIPEATMQEEITKNMEQIQKTAEERVKLDILLGKVAEEEKLQVTQEDISQIIMQESMRSGIPPEKLVEDLKNDQDRINSIRQSALFNKTLQFLVDNANITEVD